MITFYFDTRQNHIIC